MKSKGMVTPRRACYYMVDDASMHAGGDFMWRTIKFSLVTFFVVGLIFGAASCGGGASSLFTSTVPTRIYAAWSGSTDGEPSTYRAEDAEEWNGHICHSTTIELTNHGPDYAGLRIVNDCFTAVVLHICATQGNDQPNLPACAEEPSDTPYDDLEHIIIDAGGSATVETTESLSINVFYCSDEMVLGAQTPLECVGL